jgi:hypothetical protein
MAKPTLAAGVLHLFGGAAVGFTYGLIVRYGIKTSLFGTWLAVMSVGFLFVLPFAVGFVSVYLAERSGPQPVWIWLLLPWLAVVGGIGAAIALFLEGWICAVMFLPNGLALGSVGGLVGGLLARHQRSKYLQNATAAFVLLLPFLFTPWEGRVFAGNDVRTVENVIEIQASPAAVWEQIKSVPPIRKDELVPSWSRRIGFPDPIAATLSREGVGGVRRASFSGGVLFLETVDVWQPPRRLAFSIQAQSAHIPPTTLDEHVVVGGPFFDVLRGEYVIEPLPGGTTRLHLFSRHRLSTNFNWYAHFWTDAVMSDLQKTILYVIRERAEGKQETSVPH